MAEDDPKAEGSLTSSLKSLHKKPSINKPAAAKPVADTKIKSKPINN